MKKLICLIVMIAIAGSAGAGDTWTGGGSDTDWNTAANWGGTLPTAGSNPTLDNTDIATISSDVLTAYNKVIMDGAGAEITHTAGEFGAGSTGYDLQIEEGTYNLNGGTMNLRNVRLKARTGTLKITSGTLQCLYLFMKYIQEDNATMKIIIEGGTVNPGKLELKAYNKGATGGAQTLQVIGDSANITIGGDFNLGDSEDPANFSPELNLEFDTGGITVFNVTGNFSIIQGDATLAAKLVVDVVALGSAGQTTYDLIKYGLTQSGAFGTKEVTDLDGPMSPGTWDSLGHHEYAIKYDGGAGNDTVQIQVNTTPEPAFLGILGLGVLAFIRRK